MKLTKEYILFLYDNEYVVWKYEKQQRRGYFYIVAIPFGCYSPQRRSSWWLLSNPFSLKDYAKTINVLLS